MKYPISFAIALVSILATGFVHGLWTDRWGNSSALEEAISKVDRVPMEFGDWIGKSGEADAKSFAQSGALAYWSRVYQHRRHQEKSMSVILMAGRTGRMAVHTPEVCYRGIGFEMKGSAAHLQIPTGQNSKAQFWSAEFGRLPSDGQNLRIFWAWNDGQGWQAPNHARWHFRGAPYLFKLYVVRNVGDSSTPLPQDPGADFLSDFLPILQGILQKVN